MVKRHKFMKKKLLPLSQNNSDTSQICLSQNNSDTSQKTLFQSNAMSDFLQNRICCTSQHTEQCFYGHEVDLTLPLASRVPQRLYGVVPAFLSDFLQNRICCTSRYPEQSFYVHEVGLTLPLASPV